MFSTSKEMIASTPGSGGGMVRVQLRTCLCASALILAGLALPIWLSPAAPMTGRGA
jgi:hypothetical protein